MDLEDLTISSLELFQFRNYPNLHLDNFGSLTIFIGENGVGKTNILEGIQLLTALNSFKHPKIDNLIHYDCHQAKASTVLSSKSRQIEIDLLLRNGKREYRLNGKTKRACDIKGMKPAVIFTPDDLKLSKKSSTVKREAIDDLGGQLSRSYDQVKSDYEKIIRYKNKMLKERASKDLIASTNEMLVVCGAQLTSYRLSLFDRIIERACINYDSISNSREIFDAKYHLSSTGESVRFSSINKEEIEDSLNKALKTYAREEYERGRCVVGPHVDRIYFNINGRDVSSFASQGQQRSVVLAWKLAEVEVIKDSLGVYPVLLLDDVMSELDEKRRYALVSFVENNIQTFITATNTAYFDEKLLQRARIVNLPIVEE